MNKEIEKMFIEAYNAYSDGIFRMCYLKTSDREVSKDLLQQTFLNAWKYIKNNNETINNMRAFVYRLAHNLIIDWYRKKKPESLDDLLDDGGELITMNQDNISDALITSIETNMEFSLVISTIGQLSFEDQAYIIFRYVEDMTIGEISEILEKNENTVSVGIHRAIERLKKLLK